MKMRTAQTTVALLAFALLGGCDGSDSEKPAAAGGAEKAEKAEPAEEEAEPAASGGKLETLKAEIDEGGSFADALAAVEKQMGESPLQQGEFWNFGEYDSSGACVHMVLVRGGDKVQQVQFTKYEPGSSGYGWCAEMKIDKP